MAQQMRSGDGPTLAVTEEQLEAVTEEQLESGADLENLRARLLMDAAKKDQQAAQEILAKRISPDDIGKILHAARLQVVRLWARDSGGDDSQMLLAKTQMAMEQYASEPFYLEVRTASLETADLVRAVLAGEDDFMRALKDDKPDSEVLRSLYRSLTSEGRDFFRELIMRRKEELKGDASIFGPEFEEMGRMYQAVIERGDITHEKFEVFLAYLEPSEISCLPGFLCDIFQGGCELREDFDVVMANMERYAKAFKERLDTLQRLKEELQKDVFAHKLRELVLIPNPEREKAWEQMFSDLMSCGISGNLPRNVNKVREKITEYMNLCNGLFTLCSQMAIPGVAEKLKTFLAAGIFEEFLFWEGLPSECDEMCARLQGSASKAAPETA